MIDLFGNGKISRGDTFVVDSSLSNQVTKDSLYPVIQFHDSTDYGNLWNVYTSQNPAQVFHAVNYSGEWRIGFCVEQKCSVSKLITGKDQALQMNGKVTVFGYTTDKRLIAVEKKGEITPNQLGSVLLQ